MRVAYLGFNHPMFLVALFATAKLGAIFVPLNFRLTGPELRYIVDDAGAHTLLVGAEHLAVIEPVRDALCCLRYWCVEGEAADAADAARWPTAARGDRERSALERAGSCTRARRRRGDHVHLGHHRPAKGAMMTHGNFWWNHVAELYTVDLQSDDRLLVFAPIFHIGALNVMTLTTLLKGGRLVMHRGFDPVKALQDLEAHASRSCSRCRRCCCSSASSRLRHREARCAADDHVRRRAVPEPLLHTWNDRGIAVQQGTD